MMSLWTFLLILFLCMMHSWLQGREDISSFYSDKQDKCTGNEVDYYDYS